MSWFFGPDKAELEEMPAQGIDNLGPLPHQEIARPEHESGGLGLLAFGSHEAHGRALGGLADRLGIRGIVLLPLDEWLDVRRRDQPDRMPEHADLAGPRGPNNGRCRRPPWRPCRGAGPPRTGEPGSAAAACGTQQLLRHPLREPERCSSPDPNRWC